jgi:hypothetical protein
MTTKMVRKQIYINKLQDEFLKRFATEHGLSEAEVIRQFIEREATGTSSRHNVLGFSAIDRFTQVALSKRELEKQKAAYQWKREEIYSERENRWLRDRKEE